MSAVGSVKHGIGFTELPPSKRLRGSEPPTWQETILGKFGLPTGKAALEEAIVKKAPAILERFQSIEWIKPATPYMLITEPLAVYQSIKVQNLVARALSIFRFGQQSPDWYDRLQDVMSEAGKFSDYDVIYEGTLSRDGYMRVYKELENVMKESEVDVEHLARLLFYVDSYVTAESEKPSYQSLTAVMLFAMQEFIRKTGSDPTILELKGHDFYFSYSDCDILKWPEKRLQEICDKLCSQEAPEPLKDELKKALSRLSADTLL